MDVGVAVAMQNPNRQQADHEVYWEERRLADLTEPLGFDSFWTVEHHFDDYTMVPDVCQFLTYVAGRTSRIKLGTAVIVLPWHDPVRVAEQVSMLDILSEGRLLLAGPLPAIDALDPGPAGFTGSLIVAEFDSLKDARSWAETDMAQLKSGRVELNADKGDKAGPVTIGAVTATNATDAPKPDPSKTDQRPPESRFVTIGDSDFAANYAIRIQGNQDLFLNTINWLAQQENLISIRPRSPSDSHLTITARQATAVLWMSLLVVPALVFGTGVYTWWRKR